jgi:hypothetical protein
MAIAPAPGQHYVQGHDAMPSRMLSMTMVLESHDHLLRLTIRERGGVGGRRLQWRVLRVNKRCRHCQALTPRLLRSSREFRARLETLISLAV